MNRQHILPAVVFVAFGVFTGWVVARDGMMPALEAIIFTGGGQQVFIDLCITMTILMTFIWRDARSRGIDPRPYVFLCLLGSFGPLLYLLRRASTSAGAKSSR
ncbi:MAG: hypothetical protein KC549_19140 [Myxococcales bacterium]|nr:hypothetical protein [Myxococcales bacterium]